MDHRKSNAAPRVKTGAQVILSRVLLKREVVDRAHRMGWISTSKYKKLIKTKQLEDTNDLSSRIPDISRKEDSFSTRLEYDSDNFKENEKPVHSDSLSRKRKRDDVDANLSSPSSSPLRAQRRGRMKQPKVQNAQSVSKEVRRSSVELDMDSTKKTRNLDEGPHSSLNLSEVSSSSNTSNSNAQKIAEMGGSFERQQMGMTEEGEVFKQTEIPPPTLEKGTESDYMTSAKVSPEGSVAAPVNKKMECISSCEVTGNKMPVTEDVQITNQMEMPCVDNEWSDTLPQLESLLSKVDTLQQNVGICTKSGDDRSRTDDDKYLTSDSGEENLICEASQVEDIQVSKEAKTFTQSLSDDIYDKLRQDFVGETCVRDGSWSSMDGKDNSNKRNEVLSSKAWEKKMDSETFQMLLKNAVVESVFQSPEAQEQRNKIEKYQEKLALLEIENRRLQDVTANLKILMNDLEKGIDRRSTRGTQVNMDVDLKRISERQKGGKIAPVSEVLSVGTNPNSITTAPSVSLPESSVPFGTPNNYVDYLHNLLSSCHQAADNSGGQCNQCEVPGNCSEAVEQRVSGKTPEPAANGSGLVVVKKEPQDDIECDNSSSVLPDSFSTTVQTLPIGHFASISTNYTYLTSVAPSTAASSNAPPLNTVPPVQYSQYPRPQIQPGVQEYPNQQPSLVQGIHHQNQPKLQVQTRTASHEEAQVQAHRMQIHSSFLARGQHQQQFLPQHQQQFLPQQQQQLLLQRQQQLLQQRQQQLLLQQPVGQNYLHPGALLTPVSSYKNNASLHNPRLMNVQARPPYMPRLQTTVNQAVYNQHQPQPSPVQPFGVNVESANIAPPNRLAPLATSLSTNNGQLYRHNPSRYVEWSLGKQQLTHQRLRLQRERALEYQRYKQEQMRIKQQSPQAKDKTTTWLAQPTAHSSSQNKFSATRNVVTRDTTDKEVVCVTDDNAATVKESNTTVTGSTSSAVASSRKLPVETDGRGDHLHSSQTASSKILMLTPPTTPSSLSPPGIIDNQVKGSGTSSVATTEVIASAKRSLDTPPMPIVDKIDNNPPTSSVTTDSTAVLEPVVSCRNKLQDRRASTQYEESNLPPKPSISVAFVQGNVVLTWNMTKMPLTPISKYQLYSYLVEDLTEVTGNPWRNIGTMAALPLPMACSLTEFEAGLTYCFAVSAVDIYGRMGLLSTPSKVTVTKDGEGND